LGITRAVLVNDKLLKKLEHLENTTKVYKGIAIYSREVLIQMRELARSHHGYYSCNIDIMHDIYIDLAAVFGSIGVYEPQQTASVAFTNFSIAHK
jgi:hypothetical protein